MEVTILEFGTPKTVTVEEGASLADALEAAGVDSDAAIRFQGSAVSGDEAREIVLVPGATVVATPPDVDHG